MLSKLLGIALVFAVLNCAVNGQRVDLPFKNFTSLSEALQDAEKFILKFNETYNMPSLTFGLSVKGKPVWKKAWGFADLENYVPSRTTTRQRIASVSKTFTATLIGTFVDKGLLHFDDPVSKYLSKSIFPIKKWNGKAVNITIRQMLSHTAGLHVNEMVDFDRVEIVQNVTQMLHQFKDEQLQFEPGSHFNYSNYGYQLLGAVIESVTQKPFQVVMSDFLLQNGLNSTYVCSPYTILHNSARYYKSKDPKHIKEIVPSVPVDDILMLQGYWPAGGIYSNIEDLLHYGQLLIDAYKGRRNKSQIISQNTLKQLWSTQARNTLFPFYVNFDYGLGWFVADGNTKLKHRHIVGHQGGLPGANSMLLIYPDEEIVGVALTNRGGVLELDEMIVYTVENVYDLAK